MIPRAAVRTSPGEMLARTPQRWIEVSALLVASSCFVACGGNNSVDFFQASGAGPSSVGSGGSTSDSAGSTSISGGGSASAGAPASAGNSGSAGNSASAGAGDNGGASGSAGTSASGGSAEDAGSPSSDSAGASDGGATSQPNDLPCSPVMEGTNGASGPFGTRDASCWRVSDDLTGWGCNNMQGRTVKVNGTPVRCAEMPLPDKLDGAYYFDFSAGDHDYAGFYWF